MILSGAFLTFRPLRFVAALALISQASIALADDWRTLAKDAESCSVDALKAYAIATCETAEAIMTAAIAKCRQRWSDAVAAAVAEREADPKFRRDMAKTHENAVKFGQEKPSTDPAFDAAMEHIKMLNIFDDEFTRMFKSDHAIDVFDERVEHPQVCGRR